MSVLDHYMTIKEAADKWGVSPRRVQLLCSEGRIDGAEKVGRIWMIPSAAAKPKDARIRSGNYKNWRKEKQADKQN